MTFYKMNELIMFKLSTKVSVEKPLSPSAKCFASSRTLIQTKKNDHTVTLGRMRERVSEDRTLEQNMPFWLRKMSDLKKYTSPQI